MLHLFKQSPAILTYALVNLRPLWPWLGSVSSGTAGTAPLALWAVEALSVLRFRVQCLRCTTFEQLRFFSAFSFLCCNKLWLSCIRAPSISSLVCLRDETGFPSALLTWSLPSGRREIAGSFTMLFGAAIRPLSLVRPSPGRAEAACSHSRRLFVRACCGKLRQ